MLFNKELFDLEHETLHKDRTCCQLIIEALTPDTNSIINDREHCWKYDIINVIDWCT